MSSSNVDTDILQDVPIPSKKELEASFPTTMKNPIYSRLVENYCLCVSSYVSQITIPQLMEKQLARTDIDTVCAYELY